MRLSDHAVSVMGDDPEAVRDGFRDGLPLTGKGFVEKAENRLGELPQIRVEPVTPHVAVHDPPQALDRGRLGRVGREEVQPDAALRSLQERFGAFAWCWRALSRKTWIAAPPGRARSSLPRSRRVVVAPVRPPPPVVSFIVSRFSAPCGSGAALPSQA